MRKPPTGNLFRDYDLHQAFEKLGLRKFPETWNGNHELLVRPTEDSPEAVRQRKQEIEARSNDIRREREVLRKRASVAASEHKKENYAEDIRGLDKEEKELWEEFHCLPNAEDLERDADAYTRRCQVEEALVGALWNEELTWWCVYAFTVDQRVWDKNAPGFHYCIELSCVWWRPGTGSRRRGLVRLHHGVFDEWLERNFPARDSEHDKERQAEAWFRRQMQAPDNPDWRRDHYATYMRDAFGIGPQAFKRIWRAHASRNMRKPGRPPKSKQRQK